MNLHGAVAAAIGAVNPHVAATLRVSTGAATDAAGRRAPTYTDVPDVPAQVQPLQYTDLQLLDGLNLTGERRSIYLNGRFDGVNRPRAKGGDLVVFPSGAAWPFGTTWLIAVVAEQWPDWCRVLATLQLPAT